ncbi:polysaccharide deacetylase family protein [Streptomyces sp. NPDC047014]|uniref:polysaccharide deacetylase family protein n=1 Tax=Streptomyces sp. NPDC047014 TaxID=3155736 RepID=UPI00340CBE9A
MALTFDAAWDEAGVADVLAELRQRALPATFFPTGAYADARPAAVRAMGAEHGLGNHSYSHPYFDGLDSEEHVDEVRRADAAVEFTADTNGYLGPAGGMTAAAAADGRSTRSARGRSSRCRWAATATAPSWTRKRSP